MACLKKIIMQIILKTEKTLLPSIYSKDGLASTAGNHPRLTLLLLLTCYEMVEMGSVFTAQ